jgi:Ion channel
MIVGYGDFYPRTVGGRIIIFFCSIYGVTIVSLIVVTLRNQLHLSLQESKVYILLAKLKARTSIEKEASNIIGTVSRLKAAKDNKKSFENDIKVYKLEESLKK